MRIILIVDLEGIIDVKDIFSRKNKEYLLKEIEFVMNILQCINVFNVDICYIHDGGKLLKEEDTKKYKCKIYNHMSSIDLSLKYNAAFMIGFHAKSMSGGYFDHTIREDIADIILGKESVGEIELYGYWLENNGIPVLLVTGEDVAEKEAKKLDAFFLSTKSIKKEIKKVEVIKSYKKMIIQSIEKNKCINYSVINKEVRVKFVNDDMIMNMQKRGYCVKDNMLFFDSLNEFILKDIFWEKDISDAYFDMIQENIKFSNYVKKHLEQLLKKDYPILNKRIDLISNKDREIMKEKLLCKGSKGDKG